MNYLSTDRINTLSKEIQAECPEVVSVIEGWEANGDVGIRVVVKSDTSDPKKHGYMALPGLMLMAMGLGLDPSAFDFQSGIIARTVEELPGDRYLVDCVANKLRPTAPERALYDMTGTETDTDAAAIFELARVGSITERETLALLDRCREHERYGAIYNENVIVTVLRAGVGAPSDQLKDIEVRQYEKLQETIDEASGTFPAPWRLTDLSGVRDGYRIGWWERADIPNQRLLVNGNHTGVI